MATALNKIVAAYNGGKNRRKDKLASLYQRAQKPELFSGMTRTYEHLDAEHEETLPPEVKLVQLTVTEILAEARRACAQWWDLVVTREAGNAQAKASVEIDGEVLAADVPVGALISLEKQLTDWRTIIQKLPIHDPTKSWAGYDTVRGIAASAPAKSNRNKKTPVTVVTVAPTEHFPAQTASWSEDRKIGEYTTVEFSGALAPQRKAELIDRVDTLLGAVRSAREEANATKVEQVKVADTLIDYLLAD